ncbi:MAG: T9SS type A sorting domain-containing protein, partial [Ignavibacteriaceae bacterium]|nr:T9SS type A sorting domain-containing protein [Ignavibacteriaceae bacterium]
YRLIYPDGSHGIHNPKYVIAALRKSIEMIGGIIPVELTEFKATTSNRVVTLNWSTSSETNNKGFEVERLTGEQWSVIGFVEGNGTTTELVNYQFIDKPKTSSTTVSYRIKQIDLDGSFNYSKAIEVELSAIPDAYTLNQNYPNPFNPSTKINFSIPEGNFVTLKVYDASGSEVTTLVNGQLESGYHEVIFDASKLTSGIYFYTLSAGEQKITKKMLLMK